MNAPNFKKLLADFRAADQEEAELEQSFEQRLKPLGWRAVPQVGAGFAIEWPDRYDRCIARVDAYPPMQKRDPLTRKLEPARVPGAADAKVIAEIIVDSVNCHDALIEALLEALPAIKPTEHYARSMVIRALDMAHAGSSLTDEDYAMASEYLGDRAGFDYASLRDSAPEMDRESIEAYEHAMAREERKELNELTAAEQLAEAQLRG